MTDRENISTRDATPTGNDNFTPTSLCPHFRMIDSERQTNCLDCGIYIPRQKCDGSNIYALREDSKISFYAEVPLGDALDQMKTIMHTNRVYSPKPNYIKYRRFLVDWMCEIGDTIRLSFTTIHHSVAIMDTFFSKVKDVETTTSGKEFLQLISLTSIFISAKFCEKDSRGPTAANISTLTKGQYSEKQILDCERLLLITIEWNLHLATPADFLILFLNQGIVFSNDSFRTNKNDLPSLKIVQYVRKYAEFFVDLCLQEYEFQRYDSHTMACAIVLASRRAVHFRKVWNEEFEFLLNCNLQDVEECYREIYKFYISSFPDKGGCKKDLGKEDYSKHKTSHHESSTNRQASSTLKQRSNSIKSHLCSIETKNVHYSKPRNNTKRNDSIQKRDNSSIPRISTNTEILKCLKDNSLNCNVTTPDKCMINANKNSSSNKKSSIKRFKPNILHQSRIPKPIMYDSNQRKPKIQSRNPKIDCRKTTKLDFDLSNLGMKVDNTSKSRKSLIPCNTSYQHISHNSSGMDTSYNKENTINQSTQNLRPNLKLKISKSKIYTTMDAKPELSRNKSFLKSNSKGSSTHNINESLTNYRSSSNLRPAMSRPNIIHNSSIKYSCTGLGIHTGVPSHNKSYGKIHINTIRQ